MACTVRFTDEHLALFAAASGDRNPLHLSVEYASRTSYGQRVAFGALGALLALGHAGETAGIRKISADYLRPIFAGVDYEIRRSEHSGNVLVRLFDGTVPVLSLTVHRGDGVPEVCERPPEPHFELSEANISSWGDLNPGLSLSGIHRTDAAARHALCTALGIAVPPALADVLLWGSYVVGMQLPGVAALFFRFRAEFTPSVAVGTVDYTLAVRALDDRMDLVHVDFRLSSGGSEFARGDYAAFVRAPAPEFSRELLQRDLPPSERLTGKVAIVAGASRGLGAVLARALASQGATVVALSRSGAALDPQYPMRTAEADIADVDGLKKVRDDILREYGHIDIVIANAFPAPVPLNVEVSGYSRIRDYVARATEFVLAPLCVFAGDLSSSRGLFVLISSEYAERPVKALPQYVAAKRAVEGVVEVAALQYPALKCVVIRPPKLLTEMTNTPVGKIGAIRTEAIAASIVKGVCEDGGGSGYQVMSVPA